MGQNLKESSSTMFDEAELYFLEAIEHAAREACLRMGMRGITSMRATAAEAHSILRKRVGDLPPALEGYYRFLDREAVKVDAGMLTAQDWLAGASRHYLELCRNPHLKAMPTDHAPSLSAGSDTLQ